jgi:hypothetical protein
MDAFYMHQRHRLRDPDEDATFLVRSPCTLSAAGIPLLCIALTSAIRPWVARRVDTAAPTLLGVRPIMLLQCRHLCSHRWTTTYFMGRLVSVADKTRKAEDDEISRGGSRAATSIGARGSAVAGQQLSFGFNFCRWRVRLRGWYVSNVSIIFNAPCLFIHHLLCVLLHFVVFNETS